MLQKCYTPVSVFVTLMRYVCLLPCVCWCQPLGSLLLSLSAHINCILTRPNSLKRLFSFAAMSTLLPPMLPPLLGITKFLQSCLTISPQWVRGCVMIQTIITARMITQRERELECMLRSHKELNVLLHLNRIDLQPRWAASHTRFRPRSRNSFFKRVARYERK